MYLILPRRYKFTFLKLGQSNNIVQSQHQMPSFKWAFAHSYSWTFGAPQLLAIAPINSASEYNYNQPIRMESSTDQNPQVKYQLPAQTNYYNQYHQPQANNQNSNMNQNYQVDHNKDQPNANKQLANMVGTKDTSEQVRNIVDRGMSEAAAQQAHFTEKDIEVIVRRILAEQSSQQVSRNIPNAIDSSSNYHQQYHQPKVESIQPSHGNNNKNIHDHCQYLNICSPLPAIAVASANSNIENFNQQQNPLDFRHIINAMSYTSV